VTRCEHLAVTGGETGATTDDDHLLDPGRLKPPISPESREQQDPRPRPDAVEALLRQFRPAIVRYCRSRLARTRARTGSLDEDDVAQEVCLALLSALPSYRDMGRPFGAFVFAIAAHKVADAARGAARAPLPVRSRPTCPTGAWDRRKPC
jgi:DNA-directed RNA polymerase specialized sigma24 family protein